MKVAIYNFGVLAKDLKPEKKDKISIFLGDQEIRIVDEDGILKITTDGQISIFPYASNQIRIKPEKDS